MGASLLEINQMSAQGFVSTLGWVFEQSPWVAEKAWERIPFHSKEHLLGTMISIVQKAGKALQLSLLRSHPDLGTKLNMSAVSLQEQSEAGLAALSEQEFEDFSLLNWVYVDKFGFPFIMAVKGKNKSTILEAMKERIYSSIEEEWNHALNEVFEIASFRLNNIIP